MNAYDHDIECQALACLMRTPHAIFEAPEIDVQWFHNASHKIIFNALKSLIDHGEDTSPVFVLRHLREGDVEDLAGGRLRVFSIPTSYPNAAGFKNLARSLRQMHDQRRMIEVASDALDALKTASTFESALESVYQASQQLAECAETSQHKRGYTTSAQRFDIAKLLLEGRPKPLAISTGFEDVDKVINGGWSPGRLYVVAARPGMGKTAFMMQCAAHAAVHLGKNVFYGSLEMDLEECMQRWIAQFAGISLELLLAHSKETPTLSERHIGPALEVMRAHAKANICLSDADQLNGSLSQLIALINQTHRNEGALDLVVVDYAQLLTVSAESHRQREQEVAQITRSFKRLSKRLKCAVVLVAQLNRDCERRSSKRPLISDLRESGAFEQDADVVILPFREGYYDDQVAKSEEPDVGFDAHPVPDFAHIIVGKNRHGPIGAPQLVWEKYNTRFATISRG